MMNVYTMKDLKKVLEEKLKGVFFDYELENVIEGFLDGYSGNHDYDSVAEDGGLK